MKRFRVIVVSKNSDDSGLYAHVLVSQTGEAWRILRASDQPLDWQSGKSKWEQGRIVNIPDVAGTLLWEQVAATPEQQMPTAPTNVARDIWDIKRIRCYSGDRTGPGCSCENCRYVTEILGGKAN